MRFKAKEWDFICTKRSKDGLYDLMIYNPLRKELFLEEDVNEKYIKGIDSYGNTYNSVELSRKTFNDIFEKLSNNTSYSGGFFYDWGKEEIYRRNKKNEIPKETIFKAIRGELSQEELNNVVQKYPEPADYYDFDAFMSMIHKLLRGEISERYYLDWTIVVSWALQSNSFKINSKKSLLYENMSDCFDGHSFATLGDEKEVQCREMIAFIKHYNHSLINIRKAEEPPFYNANGIAVYICFEYFNHYNSFYKLCVADEENKIFIITRISNPDYLENVNYTFIESDKFDNLTNTYYDFYLDKTIDVHKYITELPYLDIDGNPA